MEYIIFDLEWNNAFNYKIQKGMNEIIEIGALKLNSNLEIVDTFKQLIKPKLSKRLRSSFKSLTHITMDEIKENGIPFEEAFKEFSRWCGKGDLLFLSWSTSDLYTLVENYKRFKGTANVDFMKKYADAQKYCMHFLDDCDSGNQISLSNCATKFNIEADNENLHRALEDCYLTAQCMKKVFDKELLENYISVCNVDFFERLVFKPFYISRPKYNEFSVSKVEFICDSCKSKINRIKGFEFNNNSFRSVGKCSECKKTYWLNVRAKQTYDGIVVSAKALEMNKKRAKKVEQ